MVPIAILVGLGLGGLLILGGVLWLSLTRSKTNNPTLDAVISAVTPYVYRGILAGEYAVQWAEDAAIAQIDAADKKAVADSLYSLLPDTLMIPGFPFPLPASVLKRIVTQEIFEKLVKDAFDSADAFILANEKYLKAQIDALNPPAPTLGTSGTIGTVNVTFTDTAGTTTNSTLNP